MAISNKDYKVTGRPPADVFGQPPGTGLVSDISRINGNFKHGVTDSGENHGSHPAKSQPKNFKAF